MARMAFSRSRIVEVHAESCVRAFCAQSSSSDNGRGFFIFLGLKSRYVVVGQ